MARKTDPEAPAIDPEAPYRVTLARTVDYAGQRLRARDAHVLKGKVVVALGDAVKSFEPA